MKLKFRSNAKLKSLTLPSVVLVGLSLPSFCYATNPLIARCYTADDHFTVSVFDNTVPVPTEAAVVRKKASVRSIKSETTAEHAIVRDIYGKLVGVYAVSSQTSRANLRPGGVSYRDIATNGQSFALEGPGKQFNNIGLDMILNHSEFSGANLFDPNMNCQRFAGKDLYEP